MYPDYPNYETWREVAFSHQQIQYFLSILALPHYEAEKMLPVGSELRKCFGIGFYFFCQSIRDSLPPDFAEDLLNLAIRVGHSSFGSIRDQNAEKARQLLAGYENDTE